ncbi:hypothetical protein BBP40_002015 [Aspergillus hancockii]|nr:hypothetical protein BBP40_002015 [Aspergillus hancockii]
MPSIFNQNGPTAVHKSGKAAKTTDGNIDDCGELFKAAKAGDGLKIQELLDGGAEIDEQCKACGGITPIIAAAISGKQNAVEVLSRNNANVNIRDYRSYTIIKLTLDKGVEVGKFEEYKNIAQWIVDNHPDMIVTDPRLPKGATWLTAQFWKMSNNIPEEISKPPESVLKYLLTGDEKKYPEVKGRSVSEVYWEHILLRYIGDIPLDIKRNYSINLKMAFVGTFDRILYGHKGIEESARLLNCVLPTTQYNIIGTHVAANQQWVTERWEYHDTVNKLQVLDGIDTFLIDENEGQIVVMLINYRVYKAEFEFIDNPERCRSKSE